MSSRIALKRVLVGALASVIASAVRLAQALAWPFAAYVALSYFGARIDPEAPDPFAMTLMVLGTLALQTVIAITTHRVLMLGDDSIPTWGLYRWTMRETRFMALVIGIGLMVILALPFAMLIPVLGPGLLLAAVIVVGACVSLVFPAAAIDKPISYIDAWHMAQGNIGPLIVCVWLFPIALALPIALLAQVPYAEPVIVVLQMLITVLTLAVLSTAYREINRPTPPPSEMSPARPESLDD